MQNLLTYLNGITIAFYFAVCLLCGLQLVCHIFGSNRYTNSVVSRLLGSVLLTWGGGAVLYSVYTITNRDIFAIVGNAINVAAFAGMACMAYALYANQWPKLRTILSLSLPYGVMILFMLFCPHRSNETFVLVTVCLMGQFLYYFHASHRHEQLLNDLYADPERHSLKWLITFVGMYGIYWSVRIGFYYSSLSSWCDMALYTYMSILILFIFAKVCTHGKSVSLDTLEQVEQAANENNAKPSNEKPSNSGHVVDRLHSLMTNEHLYLHSDLTIEEVALRLNTNPKYLSAVLNKEMHTTFSQWVNSYRIEHAKQLLRTTDDKVEYIATLCGYNSRQVFIRAFTTLTGQTPSEWRKSSN